jgi:hypothetical protein
MFGSWEEVADQITVLVAGFDPDAIEAASVVALFEVLNDSARKLNSVMTLLARRVDEVQQWKRLGYASAPEYLAAKSGTSVGAARDVLATSNKVTELPVVEDALRSGRLSGAQATLVADAAAVAPAEQSKLVNHAQRSSLRELKSECLRTKAGADTDREATHRRIHQHRRLRTWVDAEGAWNLQARGTVADGSRIQTMLDPLIDREFNAARTEGRREEREAYAFDVLVKALDQPPVEKKGQGRVRHLGLIRADLTALQRGRTVDEELCEITGLGPIPVATARELLGDAVLKLVITKGTDVVHVTHLGRAPTTAQAVALLFQQPLCTVEGCYRTRVEIDHRIDWATTHHTRLDECDPLCHHHHAQKTRHRWALIHGTGKRAMVPPTDPRHPNHTSRPPPG